MSHTTTCKVNLTNEQCLIKAIENLGLTNIGHKTHRLFDGKTVNGIGVTLPDWRYPVVVDLKSGEAFYDNYNGGWGQQIELDKLVQRYSVETALEQAEIHNYTYEQTTQQNGDIELRLQQTVSA